MTDKFTVSVLGTGIMGAAMARNLARAGHAVRVWNRTRAKAEPLAADGAGDVLPGAGGTAFRTAQDGVAGVQVDGEAAVAAADEPVAVHVFTLCGRRRPGAPAHPCLASFPVRRWPHELP